MKTGTRVLLLAGEESGLLYARSLKAALVGCEVRGYADYGFKTADLAVIGFWAVIKKLFFFLRVRRTLRRAIRTWKPEVVCTIDYPGLNLALAAYAKRCGIPTMHVVCPQVWAWKAGRIPKIEAAVDRLCCFFPFEPSLFRPGFATFVGHPLTRAFSQGGTESTYEPGLVALLPGSRINEIERILPIMLKTLTLLPSVRAVIPAANDSAYALITSLVATLPNHEQARVTVQKQNARELLCRAECALVASGTATLEAAFARCPTVLVYRVSCLLAFFARHAIKGTRYIGLANVIWDRSAPQEAESTSVVERLRRRVNPMPELLQEDFTAENAAAILSCWLQDASVRAQVVSRLDATVRLLATAEDPLARLVVELEAVLQRK